MKLDVGKVWLEGAEDVYTVRFGCGAQGICNVKRRDDVLNCEERKRRSLWLLNHLAKHVAVLKGVGPGQLQSIDSLSFLFSE